MNVAKCDNCKFYTTKATCEKATVVTFKEDEVFTERNQFCRHWKEKRDINSLSVEPNFFYFSNLFATIFIGLLYFILGVDIFVGFIENIFKVTPIIGVLIASLQTLYSMYDKKTTFKEVVKVWWIMNLTIHWILIFYFINK